MITVNLDEKNAELIKKLIKNQIEDIKNQIKQLENDKNELEILIKSMTPSNNTQGENNIPKTTEVNTSLLKEPLIYTNEESSKSSNEESSNEESKSTFIFKETHFDYKDLPDIIFGKNVFRKSEDGQYLYVMRSGYRAHIEARVEDLLYLQEHPDEREKAISTISQNKQAILTRLLKEVDFNKLELIFQSGDKTQEQHKDQVKDQSEIKHIEEKSETGL